MATISPEDFIAGAGIVMFSFLIFPVLCGYTFGERRHPRRTGLYGIFFLGGIVGMCIGVFFAHANSVLVGTTILLALAGIMVLLRPDLWRSMLASAVLMMGFVVVVYSVLFGLIAPEFWDKYWLLAHTYLGVTIGNIPFTELGWYLSWSLFAGISYSFVSGRELVRQKALVRSHDLKTK